MPQSARTASLQQQLVYAARHADEPTTSSCTTSEHRRSTNMSRCRGGLQTTIVFQSNCSVARCSVRPGNRPKALLAACIVTFCLGLACAEPPASARCAFIHGHRPMPRQFHRGHCPLISVLLHFWVCRGRPEPLHRPTIALQSSARSMPWRNFVPNLAPPTMSRHSPPYLLVVCVTCPALPQLCPTSASPLPSHHSICPVPVPV
mmetsp:Transcript_15238/g.32865  ORF Transcript_15238/g.32865 Transcript_15238/m.32865 type:complete len:204 (-) Transcript_15238:379-990(-)